MNLDRQQLEALAAVLDEGGFERAAAVLRVSQSAVSQRIRALEQNIGSALLVRANPPHPTVHGHALLRHVRQLRLMEAEVARQLAPTAGEAVTVAVAVNADSLATWFLPAVQPVCLQQGLLLEVVLDDESTTHDRLRRGEVSACVTSLPTPIPGGVAEPLGTLAYTCVASVEFAQRWLPQGLTADSWQTAPAVAFNRQDPMHAQFIARRFGVSNAHFPRQLLPSPEAFLQAIRLGIGYGFVPLPQLGDLLQSGELLALAPDDLSYVDLYWQHWALEPEPAQRLSQAVLAGAKRMLTQTSGQRIA